MQSAQIQGRSTIKLVRGTRKVSISYRSTDPEFAKRVVDAYIEEFDAEEREARHAVQDGAKEDLAAREKALLGQLETATNSLKDYKEANAELDLRSDGNVIGAGLSDLMVRAAEARAKRLDLEKQLGTAATVTDSKRLLEISSIATLPEIRDLRTTIREKAVAFETLKKTFGYKHQTYIEAETEIQQFESKLAEARHSFRVQEFVYAVVTARKVKLMISNVVLATTPTQDVDSNRDVLLLDALSREPYTKLAAI